MTREISLKNTGESDSNAIFVIRPMTEAFKITFQSLGTVLWSNLPDYLPTKCSVFSFVLFGCSLRILPFHFRVCTMVYHYFDTIIGYPKISSLKVFSRKNITATTTANTTDRRTDRLIGGQTE